jgi:DNA-directed RNA polymerase subunit K/omega
MDNNDFQTTYLTRLTKFEIVRIIGTRATELDRGAESLIDVTGMHDALEIAEKEFKAGVIPLNIIRKLPNGKKIRLKIKKRE